MITIVFTSMWLETLMHLLIVRDHGEDTFKKYDFRSYEDKLRLLGCSDQPTLERATRFHECRRVLIHEKAHFDNGEIKLAQDEADNAHELLVAIDRQFMSVSKVSGTAVPGT